MYLFIILLFSCLILFIYMHTLRICMYTDIDRYGQHENDIEENKHNQFRKQNGR